MALTKVSYQMLEGVPNASSSASAATNTAAINAALNSGADTVVLYSDGGTYLVNGSITIPSGVTFIGVGLPTIKAQDNAFLGGGNVFEMTSATGSTIDGFKIDANRQNNGGSMYGIYGSLCSKCEVKNCTVINTEYGIYFNGGNTLRITDNLVEDGAAYGITVKLSDVNADCYNIYVANNECKNISSGGTGPLVEGQGIIIYGATGLTSASYKNITEVVVNDNVCSNCGRQGITLTAVNDFVVNGNNCYDNLANTDLASGILISEACYNGAVSGNTCTNNYDAGILLDVVDQTGDRFSYGYITVSGNSCDRNTRTGIKINSMPYSTITGNMCSNSQWGIFLAKGGFNAIVGNTVLACSETGIRLPGVAGATGDDQTNVVISDNVVAKCATPVGSTYAAIYVDHFNGVKIQSNLLKDNTQDLTVKSTCSNVTILNNTFTSNLYVDTSASVLRWQDEFRTTATGKNFFSNQFGGSGTVSVRLEATFTIPHFGLSWLPIQSVSPVTSNATTAIYGGYEGQTLELINFNVSDITILHNANTKNLGNASVVLAFGETVRYMFTTGVWAQMSAKVATTI